MHGKQSRFWDYHSLIKLNEGVQWKVKDPDDYLQKKVNISAKIDRGDGPKSFGKTMYMTKLSITQGFVVLGDSPAT